VDPLDTPSTKKLLLIESSVGEREYITESAVLLGTSQSIKSAGVQGSAGGYEG
jgi:hypothetical protein